MLTIYFFKGLPGSGKSTEAKRMVAESNCGIVRVNKDDIRAMCHSGKHSKGNEAMVLQIRDAIIGYALHDGKHVIVDDTNFEPKHLVRIEELAQAMRDLGREVKIEERFFDTLIEECIARDNKRANGVGESVIRGMYNKYLKPKDEVVQKPEFNPYLPNAIIVDIDGTLAKMDGRGPFEWDKVMSDKPHEDIVELVTDFDLGPRSYRIILLSGRDEVCRKQTEEWLYEHAPFPYDFLAMRPAGNMEKDAIIKKRMYDELIKDKYNVAYVLDDRDQVVQMWRSLGLRCLQVAPGNF